MGEDRVELVLIEQFDEARRDDDARTEEPEQKQRTSSVATTWTSLRPRQATRPARCAGASPKDLSVPCSRERRSSWRTNS